MGACIRVVLGEPGAPGVPVRLASKRRSLISKEKTMLSTIQIDYSLFSRLIIVKTFMQYYLFTQYYE